MNLASRLKTAGAESTDCPGELRNKFSRSMPGMCARPLWSAEGQVPLGVGDGDHEVPAFVHGLGNHMLEMLLAVHVPQRQIVRRDFVHSTP